MAGFIGQVPYQLDDKGRVPMPPRYRPFFDGPAILTAGADRCIAVYTQAAFDAEGARLEGSVDPSTRSGRNQIRKFFGNADPVNKDAQGRLNIPARLVEYAGLKPNSPVVVVGMNDHYEIWDRDTLEALDEEGEE
ncbi:MAG TPA: hypothetical protein PKA49_03275 [Tepidiformaceae bacterium]|jgi:MraZ protein|nr:hypothetical protein [Tepidiformaceae bacterium]